ncbi:MAG TPA: reverse transcriptase domain-containing protein, partial [Polyangiaceae bacterium]|nr:reverse transcriptase domain-containing protein [Polyangiaceae bacterium]
LIKQFLKSTGNKGIPQGSPLSPLLANVALNDLDHILGRGYGYLTYVRYLDDMVVLTFDSKKGHRWAARALERIRQEAAAIGVSLNAEKTRVVTLTEPDSSFAFLGL